jgi:hypothetical protein
MENQNIDILTLIQNNKLNCLKHGVGFYPIYTSKVIAEFTSDEQKEFIKYFYEYLNHDDYDTIVINLQDIWKWLGFKSYEHAKSIFLKNSYEKDVEYKFGKKTILLTIFCFLHFCFHSDIKKAYRIYKYHCKLDSIIKETVREIFLNLQ